MSARPINQMIDSKLLASLEQLEKDMFENSALTAIAEFKKLNSKDPQEQ